MNPNRLIFLVIVAGGLFFVLGSLFVGGQSIFAGMSDKEQQILSLQRERDRKKRDRLQLEMAKKRLDQWKEIALPNDITVVNVRYKALLFDMARKHQLTVKSINDGGVMRTAGTRTSPLVVPITFQLTLEGTLPHYLAFLRDFYRLNLPHLIRGITFTPAGPGGEAKIDANLKIEVLTMAGIPPRDFLLAIPDKRAIKLEAVAAMYHLPTGMVYGLGLFLPGGLYGRSRLADVMNPNRDYLELAKKNVFAGLVPAYERPVETVTEIAPDRDLLKFIQLTSITSNFIKTEATLRNRLANQYIRLREDGGFNEMEIRDENNQVLLKGKVLAINPRQVVFETGGKTHVLHIGETLAQALEKALTPEEKQRLKIETVSTLQP
jgi:hypothetical protein